MTRPTPRRVPTREMPIYAPPPASAPKGRHAATKPRAGGRGEPRAHWVLLLLGVVVLLAELAFNGFVRHVGAEGSNPPPIPADQAGTPVAMDGAGPVLRLGPDGTVTSRSMPAGTIALTFDDGPDPQWTPQILTLLDRYHAHATFFVIGSHVNEYPDVARQILAQGSEIGVHTFTHAQLATVAAWRRRLELTLCQNAIAGATGRLATLMRPPYSSEPDAVSEADFTAMRDAARADLFVVLADHDTNDWKRPGVPAIVSAATPEGGKGAVVMMHDGGGDRSQTVAGVEALLKTLTAKGYRFTTVSAGLGLSPADVAASTSVSLRGQALRWAQIIGSWLATAMLVLLALASLLTVLRLALQFGAAHIQVRRVRRRRQQLLYLGPVSVIVPAYNEEANIASTVKSLVDSDYPDVEVIVVDDGSTDDTYGIVSRLNLPGVRVVRQDNAGKPAALNTGIALARNDLLILVDGDTVFQPDAVGRLLQRFIDPKVGAISGNTKVANRRGLLGRWQHVEYVMGFNLDRRLFEIAECMPTVPGAIGAFRRVALAEVGGVSAATLAEDTDLTMAIIRADWRVVYEESAIAWTEAPSSLRQLWRQRYRWCYGTMQAMWKHRRAFVERGLAGKLGRRGLAYLLMFQVLLPLAAPALDAYAIYGAFFQPWTRVAGLWFGFFGLQLLAAAYALRLDGERLRTLWVLPLQQVVYRALMYLVVVQSTVTALAGIRLKWHRIDRTGQAAEALRATS
jgi:cellulose synthase/poly-beta-1,6-N-acetylglucosamine synthase-like glycosyltransferase/peptidoglycan/xylan/chitin deacetylase (PgdA/CDA1 family)